MMPLNMPVSASRSSSTSEPEYAQLSRRAGPGEIRRVRLLRNHWLDGWVAGVITLSINPIGRSTKPNRAPATHFLSLKTISEATGGSAPEFVPECLGTGDPRQSFFARPTR